MKLDGKEVKAMRMTHLLSIPDAKVDMFVHHANLPARCGSR